MLSGGDDVAFRRIGDDDAALGRGRHVDVVDAHARATDHLEVPGLLDQRRVDLRGRAHKQRVELADLCIELAVVPIDTEGDVVLGLEQLDACVGDLFLDQYLGRHRRRD